MRPCLNPGQMNPPGGTCSPAAWFPPLPPCHSQTLCAPLCLLPHPYFSQCLTFTSVKLSLMCRLIVSDIIYFLYCALQSLILFYQVFWGRVYVSEGKSFNITYQVKPKSFRASHKQTTSLLGLWLLTSTRDSISTSAFQTCLWYF